MGEKKLSLILKKSPALAMAFDILSMTIDRDKEKYVKRCEKNRENIQKRWTKAGKQSNTNVYAGKQSNTKHTDKDKDKDMDMERDSNIDYQQIADMYNEICISFPRLTKLSDSRKKAIRARLNQYAIEDFKRLFELAEESSFLKGQNARNWSANFDWLIKDSNMAKVLDGNYMDRKGGGEVGADNQSRGQAADFYKRFLGSGDGD